MRAYTTICTMDRTHVQQNGLKITYDSEVSDRSRNSILTASEWMVYVYHGSNSFHGSNAEWKDLLC